MSLLKRMNLFKGLLFPIVMLGVLIIFGTIGYMTLEQYTFLEALYTTVITIASVGFDEVRHLDNPGRVFTIFLIFINLALFTYFITLLSRYFFDLDILKKYKKIKMDNKIQQLSGHVIICGFGRNGKESAKILHTNKVPFVVIEERNEKDTDRNFEVPFYITGNATNDEFLLEAGIKNARALISTLPVDSDNLFVVLSARQLNPAITIISRASQDSSINKLKIAGANNVIMPDKIGGAHMATLVMLPDVVELLSMMSTRNNTNFRIAELKVQKNISLRDLDLWKKTNCTILGVKDSANSYAMNPHRSYNIQPGECLIVMGGDEEIGEARKLI